MMEIAAPATWGLLIALLVRLRGKVSGSWVSGELDPDMLGKWASKHRDGNNESYSVARLAVSLVTLLSPYLSPLLDLVNRKSKSSNSLPCLGWRCSMRPCSILGP